MQIQYLLLLFSPSHFISTPPLISYDALTQLHSSYKFFDSKPLYLSQLDSSQFSHQPLNEPEDPFLSNYPTRNYKDFLENNMWNVQKLYNSLPSHMALHIISIKIGQGDIKDYAVWNITEDGRYSNVSVWNLIRTHRQGNTFNRNIWHKSLPFKMSFLCWRLVYFKLPFAEALAKFGNNEDVDCLCCRVPQTENMQHVFVEGDAANYIWKTMGAPLGIIHQHIPIRGLFNNWWNKRPKNNVHKLILQAIPILICWELWKAWTACKYGDHNKFNYCRMIIQCTWNIKAVILNAFPVIDTEDNWINICNKVKNLSPVVKSIPVRWNKPSVGMIKINTDGSYFSNTKNAGMGIVVRTDTGDLIRVFSIPVECNSNNLAEALAANYGVNWCIQHGYNNLHIELDSLVITNMLINKDTDNLKLKHIVTSTARLLSYTTFQITHCFREANQMADFLAKLAATSGNKAFYHSQHDLPREAKGLFQPDKWQVSTFRRRYEKCNFFVG